MKRLICTIVLLIISTACLPACEKQDDIPDIEQSPPITGPARTFALGFTDFPYAPTSEAFQQSYDIIKNDADMAVMHFDDGVPWQAALEQHEYAKEIKDELTAKTSLIPKDHLVYLAITPLSFSRDDIAPEKGGEESPWRARLDDPDVITAYTNHAEKMIDIFSPDYFAYAIEANLFYSKAPDRWYEFVNLAKDIYARIKADYPTLPVFITIQADFFHRDPAMQAAAIQQILPYTDYIAISTYPFLQQPDLSQLPGDYFTAITNLAPEKPFAISETSWPAEDIGDPYPKAIPGSEAAQLTYLKWLFKQAVSLNAVFITWFFSRDYDQFWETDLKNGPMAQTARLWKDTGLYDGNGNPRKALQLWRDELSMQRIEGEQQNGIDD